MEEKNKTIVAGKETGDLTDSGNFRHNSDGTFASKEGFKEEYEEYEVNAMEIPDDFEWDDNAYNETSDDIDSIFVIQEGSELKNIEEMENYELINEINDCEEYFLENGINLDSFTNSFNNDLKLKCSNFRQMKRLMEKYELGLDGVELTHQSDISNTVAFCKYSIFDETTTEIGFNDYYFKSYEQYKQKVKSDIRIKWIHESDEEYLACRTMTHELGHALHNKMYSDYKEEFYKQKNYFDYRKLTREEFVKDIKRDVIKKLQDKFGSIEGNSILILHDENSEYGQDNVFEWFAETFASLECGKPTKLALVFAEVLEEKGYLKGGK